MNLGECPYPDCDELLMLSVPDVTPAYARVTCDECGREFWYRFSRIDPEAWTLEEFARTHDVDEATRKIKRKVTP